MNTMKECSVILPIMFVTLTSCCYHNQNGSMKPYFIDTKSARIHASSVFSYLHKGDMFHANEELKLAMKAAPNDPIVLDTAGYFYEKIGNTSLANGYFAEAVNTSPDSGIARNNYGAFLCRNGFYDASLPLFRQAAATPNTPIKGLALKNIAYCKNQMQSGLGDSLTYAYYTQLNMDGIHN